MSDQPLVPIQHTCKSRRVMCLTCPFNGYSEESCQAQNLGCLPTARDILDAKMLRNREWR